MPAPEREPAGAFVPLEKEPSPGFGVSKASLSQIHLPDFCPTGTLKGMLCAGAPARYRRLAQELDAAYREADRLWLALKRGHMTGLARVPALPGLAGLGGIEPCREEPG